MKNHFFVIAAAVLFSATAVARPSAGHYTQLNNKSGQNLWDAIYKCTQQGYSDMGYDGLLDAYEKTDVDKNGNLIDMYGGCSFAFSKSCGSYKKECDCYNREHSLPKSWWGGTPKESKQGSDIFHVVPTDGYVNNRRSSYAFGETTNFDYSYNGNKLGSSSLSGYSGTVFEPRDEYKGDFARGYFGTMAKWEVNATKGAGSAIFNGNYTASGNFGLTEYGITLLMKWHRQDPVSEKELLRNDAIEQTQGNRNPFIDYPELAEYLWGNKKGQTVQLNSLICAYDGQAEPVTYPYISSPQSGSQLSMQAVCTSTEATLTVNVLGNNLKSNLSLALSGDDAHLFRVSPSYLTPEQVANGHAVALMFMSDEAGTYSATLTLSNDSVRDIVVNLSATARQCGTDTTTTPVPDGDYYLLETEPYDWNGIYLVVSEEYSYCLNAAVADDANKIKSAANKLKVNISDNTIKASETVDAAAVTISATPAGDYTMLSSSGYYLGISENSNTLNSSAEPLPVALSMSGTDIVVSGTASLSSRTLRYNNSSGMFRFYTSGQQPVQLYRKQTKQTPSATTDRQSSSVSLTGGILKVECSQPMLIQAFDIYGRTVINQRTENLSARLPQGIYILLIDGKPQKLISE